MNKEGVIYHLNEVTQQMPYRDYYRQRNGRIAMDIAQELGIGFKGSDEQQLGSTENHYHVPAKTITKEKARTFGITTGEDLYGAAIDHLSQVNKTILHPVVSGHSPCGHSAIFANLIEDTVLPGYSCFSKEDSKLAFQKLKHLKHLRAKVANQSDGHGQMTFNSEFELNQFLSGIDDQELHDQGMVIEVGLHQPQTISIGGVVIGDDNYVFIAKQYNDVAPEDGRDRYKGALIKVIKGVPDTSTLVLKEEELSALRKVSKFTQIYGLFDPIISRISVDVLSGYDTSGNFYQGVTDITARLGGSDPAVMQAVKYFRENPQASLVMTEVLLDYDPDLSVKLPEEELYIDHPTLRIQARVVGAE